jgi:sirohydrochlorin ferrochelatase
VPVHKFRSIEEMNEFDRQRLRANDPRLFDRVEAHWRSWRDVLPPLDLPKGVHKFRSIEEMNAFKERYENARIARIRAERIVK